MVFDAKIEETREKHASRNTVFFAFVLNFESLQNIFENFAWGPKLAALQTSQLVTLRTSQLAGFRADRRSCLATVV